MKDIEVRCEAYARLNPSESQVVLENTLKLLAYPEVNSESKMVGDELHVSFSGPSTLKKLREQAAARRVRSVLRRLILTSYRDGKVILMLNRQALTAGIIAFAETEAESPLGPVYLVIYSDDIQTLSDYLTSEKQFHR
ncbi:MAG: hypothetical protein QXT39_00610 [Conexivisphaerales archaeon]